MDDNEFRIRAFSEPGSEDPDLHKAANGDSARQRLMQEIAELEEHISSAISTVSVPTGLADRLKQQIDPEPRSRWNPMRVFMVAATVVIAAAITLIPDFTNQPSAEDAAFRDDLVAHLHEEAPVYDGDTSIRWEEVSNVLAATGLGESGGVSSGSDTPLQSTGLIFARYCDLGEAGRGAHIVLEGERGPVSVILAINKPVERTITIEDERFHGRIIPTARGNMAIIGEQGEVLTGYETIVAESIDWSI
jgi:hypothetical protein